MPDVTLTPVVTDDGWGGDLSHAWEFVTGPDTATIADPTALSTDVTCPALDGAYLFRLTVSRADDDLVGVGLWRVYVLDDPAAPPDARGAITVTANGVARTGLVQSVRISETLRGADTCQFTIYGGRVDDPDASDAAIAVFNDVIIERHNDVLNTDLRMFGGVCLSRTLTIELETQLFFHPSLVGYAWHLGRARVTQVYVDTSISVIAAELLALAPGGLSGAGIAPNLPHASIGFTDVTIAEALTKLTELEANLHWRVDYFKVLYVAVLETAAAAPLALSLAHPTMRDLAFTEDGSQLVNRVTVTYDSLVIKPVLVDAEIRVDSLEGYSASGGDTTIAGNAVHYTGTRSALLNSIYGVQIAVSMVAVEDPNAAAWTTALMAGYSFTFATALGETPQVTGYSGLPLDDPHNAVKIQLTYALGTAVELARITAINVYRNSTNYLTGDSGVRFVGTISIKGGIFIDRLFEPSDGVFHVAPPSVNTADERAYYLTGCSGSQEVHTPASVTVNDTGSQAALAAQLGGGDAGVIPHTIQGGAITEAQALTLATAFLAGSRDLRRSVTCGVYDDRAHPGSSLAVSFPAPINVSVDLTIQQATIAGFEGVQPHDHRITAATEVLTLDRLLRQASEGTP